MGAIYRFFALYEGLIYIILALAGLFAFRWLWNAWFEWRQAIYKLEREFGLRRLSQALTVSLFIVILFIGEIILASFIAPAYPSSELFESPTLIDQMQPEVNLPEDSGGLLPEGTFAPEPVNSFASGCIPGEINLTTPQLGQEVSGSITLVGTVDVENFGFYKYEVSPQGAAAWATISAGREIVKNGDIGFWDTSTLKPGDYQLRLEVTDNQGNSYPPCIIPVRVRAP
ncbi:MAG: hypothetical protein QGM50_01075 [Anaerolineae bacterium]|nr:hypothetical protein [Anaerolineae bacterium]MDK1080976.1 hypothetical protein [Anaerolineae bacterium]MDK1117359.1 hypothetical protein [Anaerolineae bacterium]